MQLLEKLKNIFQKSNKFDYDPNRLRVDEFGVSYACQCIKINKISYDEKKDVIKQYISSENFYETITWTDENNTTSIKKSHGPFLNKKISRINFKLIRQKKFWEDLRESIIKHQEITGIDFPKEYESNINLIISKIIKSSSKVYLLNIPYSNCKNNLNDHWRYDYWREYVIVNENSYYTIIMTGD